MGVSSLPRTISPPNPSGYLQVLRHNANFRNLWLGQVVSLLGDWFNLIASAALIAHLSDSAFAIGALFVVRMLAPFFISPLAGAWTDRYDRKKILIISDLLRALIVMGFLMVKEPEQLWLLYVLTGLQLAMSGVFYPARNAILPEVVTSRELGAANAVSSITWSTMLAFGAALGGLAAGFWGIYPAFVIDSFTFVLSALIIARIRIAPSPTSPSATSQTGSHPLLSDFMEGVRFLTRNPDLLSVSLLKPVAALTIAGASQVIQVRIAEGVFVVGEGGGFGLGLIYAAIGLGTGVGPICVRHFTKDRERPMRIAIILAYLVAAIGLSTVGTLESLAVVLIGMFLRGFGSGVNWVFSTQLLLQTTPSRFRGRVFSTEYALLTLMNAAGAATAGWVLDHTTLGLSLSLFVLAALTLAAGLLWAAHTYRYSRSMQ